MKTGLKEFLTGAVLLCFAIILFRFAVSLLPSAQFTETAFNKIEISELTPQQIKQKFGKPDMIMKNPTFGCGEAWFYLSLVKHDVTGNHLEAKIYFAHSGEVSHVVVK